VSGSGITIQLSRAQIDRIVHEAGQESGVSTLLRGLVDDGTLAERYESLAEDRRLSRSLLLGLLVLATFPSSGDALAVTDVAAKLGMSPSTTHRYIDTLRTVGLLEQDPRTRRYQAASPRRTS
jgi:DNA-binding MarR family transcriptional regulator